MNGYMPLSIADREESFALAKYVRAKQLSREVQEAARRADATHRLNMALSSRKTAAVA